MGNWMEEEWPSVCGAGSGGAEGEHGWDNGGREKELDDREEEYVVNVKGYVVVGVAVTRDILDVLFEPMVFFWEKFSFNVALMCPGDVLIDWTGCL